MHIIQLDAFKDTGILDNYRSASCTQCSIHGQAGNNDAMQLIHGHIPIHWDQMTFHHADEEIEGGQEIG